MAGIDGGSGLHGQMLRLSGRIALDSRLTVRCHGQSRASLLKLILQIGCAGAIISYLQKRRAARFLPGDAAAHALFRVAVLEMFSLQDIM